MNSLTVNMLKFVWEGYIKVELKRLIDNPDSSIDEAVIEAFDKIVQVIHKEYG